MALISSVLCCWVIAIVSVIGSSLFFSLLGLLLVLNVVCLSDSEECSLGLGFIEGVLADYCLLVVILLLNGCSFVGSCVALMIRW